MNIDDFYAQFNRIRPKYFGTIESEGNKLRPNQKCPCGSEKKYKKCCQRDLEKFARSKGTNSITKEEVKQIN